MSVNNDTCHASSYKYPGKEVLVTSLIPTFVTEVHTAAFLARTREQSGITSCRLEKNSNSMKFQARLLKKRLTTAS